MKTTIPLLPTRFLSGAFRCRHRGCGRGFTGADLRAVEAHPTGNGRYAVDGTFGIPGPVAVFAPCSHEQQIVAPQVLAQITWSEEGVTAR